MRLKNEFTQDEKCHKLMRGFNEGYAACHHKTLNVDSRSRYNHTPVMEPSEGPVDTVASHKSIQNSTNI